MLSDFFLSLFRRFPTFLVLYSTAGEQMSQMSFSFLLVSTHPIAHAIKVTVTFQYTTGGKSPMKFDYNDTVWSRNIIGTLQRLALHNKVRQDNVWTGVIFGWHTFPCVIMMRIRMKWKYEIWVAHLAHLSLRAPAQAIRAPNWYILCLDRHIKLGRQASPFFQDFCMKLQICSLLPLSASAWNTAADSFKSWRRSFTFGRLWTRPDRPVKVLRLVLVFSCGEWTKQEVIGA